MKQAIFFAGVAAMILASCAKERAEQDSTQTEQAFRGTVVTIQAAISGQEAAGPDSPLQNAATKTTQSGGTFSWSDGEQISVGTGDGGYTTFDLDDAETGTFSHTFVGDVVPELQMAVSPVQSYGYTSPTNFTVSLPTVYNDYVSGTTNALMIGTPATENRFLFHHAAALVKVTYENVPAGTKGLVLTTDKNIASSEPIGLSSTNAVITTGNTSLDSKSVRLNLATAVNDYSPQVFYVPVPTGTYSSFNVYLINADGKKISGTEKSSTKSFTLDRKDIFATPGITVSIIIGKEDNTSGWGDDNSQAFPLGKGERQNLIFTNHSDSGSDLWSNWVFNNAYNTTSFSIRAQEPYRWIEANINNNPGTVSPPVPLWDNEFLLGATITAHIDYFSNGLYYFDLTAEKNDESKHFVFEYNIDAKPDNINIVLISDHSHYVLKKAWKSTAEPIIRSISAQAKPDVLGAPAYVTLTDNDVVVTATMSDGSTQVLDAADYTVTFDSAKYLMAAVENGYVYSSSAAGSIATVHYTGSNGSPADCGCTLAVQDNTLEGWSIGTNLNSPWWDDENENYATRSQTFTVASGKSVTLGMKLYSKEEFWYHRPSVIVRKNGLLEEWFTAGMLGHTWVNEAETVTTDYSDIDADRTTYKAFYNNSDVYATVSNDGNGGISVRYYTYYTDATGSGVSKSHSEYFYKNIGSDQSVDFIIATEGSFEVYQKSVYMTGLEATPNAYIYGNSSYLTLDSSNLTVKAVLSDGSKVTLDPADYSVTFKNAAYNAVGSGYVFSRDESRDIADIAYTGCYGMADGTLSLSYTTQSLTEDGIGSAPASACAWWDDTEGTYATKSETFTVSSGQNVTVGMKLYSVEEGLWQCPAVVIRKHNDTSYEYFHIRMLNQEWDGRKPTTKSDDYNSQQSSYQTYLNNSHVYVTVSNDGNGGVSVRFYTYYDEAAGAEGITQSHSEYYYRDCSDQGASGKDIDFIIVMDHAYAVYEKARTLTGIEAVANAIVYGTAQYATFSEEALIVNNVYSDGSKERIVSGYTVTKIAIAPLFDTNKPVISVASESVQAPYTVTYGTYSNINCTVNITHKDQTQTAVLGEGEHYSDWYSSETGYYNISTNWNVPAGSSVTVTMKLSYKSGQTPSVWHSPSTILKKADESEYCVVRMDNYGWGDSYSAATSTDGWYNDASILSGATVYLTVTNNGNNKASVRYTIYNNSTYYYRYLDNITVDSSNVTFAIATESAYITFL